MMPGNEWLLKVSDKPQEAMCKLCATNNNMRTNTIPCTNIPTYHASYLTPRNTTHHTTHHTSPHAVPHTIPYTRPHYTMTHYTIPYHTSCHAVYRTTLHHTMLYTGPHYTIPHTIHHPTQYPTPYRITETHTPYHTPDNANRMVFTFTINFSNLYSDNDYWICDMTYFLICSPGSVHSPVYHFKMAAVFLIQCDAMSLLVYIYIYIYLYDPGNGHKSHGISMGTPDKLVWG